MFSLRLLVLSSLAFWHLTHAGHVIKQHNVCTVLPSDDGSDDSGAILEAFAECGQNGKVVFEDKTYNIEKVMKTTNLHNVDVEFRGNLLWSKNISYWRSNGLPLDYLNMTTAWQFGGDNILMDGFNIGTLDGNGQVWYDFNMNQSNLPGRPISFMIVNTTNSVFQNLRFVQSQFWTMAIRNAEDVLLENIYINSTSSNGNNTVNTDGVDTFYANRITFRNWTVNCGDDSISTKANSTNILIQDSTFYQGNGVAIGSIGQYPGVFERIENVTAERIEYFGTLYVGYLKTWTGVQNNFPPNGGGGGLGYAANITFRDFEIHDLVGPPALITQCTSYSGAVGVDCDTSKFQISDITWGSMRGTISGNVFANLQCSGAVPCPGITIASNFSDITGNSTLRRFQCDNIDKPVGFNCTEPVGTPSPM